MVPTMWTGVPDDLAGEEFALPAQFTCGWRQPLTPVRRLAFSVLWAAIFDLYKYRFATRRRHQRLYWEAWEWVASANQSAATTRPAARDAPRTRRVTPQPRGRRAPSRCRRG